MKTFTLEEIITLTKYIYDLAYIQGYTTSQKNEPFVADVTWFCNMLAKSLEDAKWATIEEVKQTIADKFEYKAEKLDAFAMTLLANNAEALGVIHENYVTEEEQEILSNIFKDIETAFENETKNKVVN